MRGILLSCILILTCTSQVFSCVCFFSFDKKFLDDITRNADVIFIGRVVEISFNQDSTLMDTKLIVIDKIKGSLSSEIVSRQKVDKSCGTAYKFGKEYLIEGYLTSIAGVVMSDGCGSWTNDKDAGIEPFDKKSFDRLVREFRKRV